MEIIKDINEDNNNLALLKIYYLPGTEYNPYINDTVIFYIEFNDKNEKPKITCHSNVIFKYFILFCLII